MRPVNSNWVGLLLFGTPLCGWGFVWRCLFFLILLFFDVSELRRVAASGLHWRLIRIRLRRYLICRRFAGHRSQ
jgi:hypothetical protein